MEETVLERCCYEGWRGSAAGAGRSHTIPRKGRSLRLIHQMPWLRRAAYSELFAQIGEREAIAAREQDETNDLLHWGYLGPSMAL